MIQWLSRFSIRTIASVFLLGTVIGSHSAHSCELIFKIDSQPSGKVVKNLAISQKNGICTPKNLTDLRSALSPDDRSLYDGMIRDYQKSGKSDWRSFFSFDPRREANPTKYVIINASRCYRETQGCIKANPLEPAPAPTQQDLDDFRAKFGVDFDPNSYRDGLSADLNRPIPEMNSTNLFSNESFNQILRFGYTLSQIISNGTAAELGAEFSQAYKTVIMGQRPPDLKSMAAQAQFLNEAVRSLQEFEAQAAQALKNSLEATQQARIATQYNYEEIEGSAQERAEKIANALNASNQIDSSVEAAKSSISKIAAENLSKAQYTEQQIADLEAGKLPSDSANKIDSDVSASIDQFGKNLNLDTLSGIDRLAQSETNPVRKAQYENITNRYLNSQGLVKAWLGADSDLKVDLKSPRNSSSGMQLRQTLNEAAGLRLSGKTTLQIESANQAMEAALTADQYLASPEPFDQERGKRLSDRARTLVDYQINSRRLGFYSKTQTSQTAIASFGVSANGATYEGYQIASVANKLASTHAVSDPYLNFYATASLKQAELMANAPGEGIRFHEALDAAYAVYDFSKGFVSGIVQFVPDTYNGLKQLVVHPVDSAEALYGAIVNYDVTYNAIAKAIDKFIEEVPDYSAEQFGELSGRVTAEVGAAILGAGLVKKGADLIKFNATVAKIAGQTRIVLRLPEVSKVEATIFRFVKTEYKENMWKVTKYDVEESVYRYSNKGVGGIYGSLSEEGLEGELLKYRVDRSTQHFASKSARLNKVLDLTNPQTLKTMGITREMVTEPNNYVTTHIIGKYAEKNGYDALIFPSATSSAKHIVLFKSLE